MSQELAGLGGDVGFIKHDVNYQLNVPITSDVVSLIVLISKKLFSSFDM